MSVPTLPVSILHIRGEGSAARVRLGGCSPHSAARVRVRELVHVCVVWQLRLLQLVLP